jgi:hypothetical protein
MFNTARTSARTLLVAASTAGFVALGAGIAGASALGGATDGLALNDLGSHVPAPLTEGVSTPLGGLVKVEPGQISAQPDVRHQSVPEQVVSQVSGNAVSTDAPIRTGEENAANVGPLDLNTVGGALPLSGAPLGGTDLLEGVSLDTGGSTLPLSHASAEPLAASPVSDDPLAQLLGGSDVVGRLLGGGGAGGGTLPLSHPESSLPLQNTKERVGTGIDRLGTAVEQGTHEVGGDLSGLDATLPASGDTLPLAAATDTPVVPVNGQNTDLTGGAADLVSNLVLSDDVTLPMAASTSPLPATVADAPADLLPLPEGTLPLAAPEVADVTGLAVDTVRTTELNPAGDFVGNDLVGVDGMPDLGQPDIDTSRLNLVPDSII